jgi:hypothetical protein
MVMSFFRIGQACEGAGITLAPLHISAGNGTLGSFRQHWSTVDQRT